MNHIWMVLLLASFCLPYKAVAQQSAPDDVYYDSGTVEARFFNRGTNGIQFLGFYENGKLKATGYYKQGQNHGEWVCWDQTGRKVAVANYQNGEKVGTWILWDPTGQYQYQLEYDKGKLIDSRVFEDAMSSAE